MTLDMPRIVHVEVLYEYWLDLDTADRLKLLNAVSPHGDYGLSDRYLHALVFGHNHLGDAIPLAWVQRSTEVDDIVSFVTIVTPILEGG